MREDILYKYRTWDDNARRMLQDNEFYFASPNDFNDPFDCSVEATFFPATRGERLEKARSVLRDVRPELSERDIDREVLRALPVGKDRHSPKQINVYKDYHNSMRRSCCGILSLASSPKSSLMWSHYAAAHSGICVGLDVNVLDSFIDRHLDDERIFFSRIKVKYEEDYPQLNFYKIDTNDLLREIFITKSRDWCYEQEHRVFKWLQDPRFPPLTKKERTQQLPEGIIREVWLGLQIPQDDEDEIKGILKNLDRKIKLKKATREKGKFALKATPVPYRV